MKMVFTLALLIDTMLHMFSPFIIRKTLAVIGNTDHGADITTKCFCMLLHLAVDAKPNILVDQNTARLSILPGV